jgi:hypothetical protein
MRNGTRNNHGLRVASAPILAGSCGEQRTIVLKKRGAPKAVLLSIHDCVRLRAPEPEVFRVIGEESRRKGTDKLTSRRIDQIIKAARAQKPKLG